MDIILERITSICSYSVYWKTINDNMVKYYSLFIFLSVPIQNKLMSAYVNETESLNSALPTVQRNDWLISLTICKSCLLSALNIVGKTENLIGGARLVTKFDWHSSASDKLWLAQIGYSGRRVAPITLWLAQFGRRLKWWHSSASIAALSLQPRDQTSLKPCKSSHDWVSEWVSVTNINQSLLGLFLNVFQAVPILPSLARI